VAALRQLLADMTRRLDPDHPRVLSVERTLAARLADL